MFKLFIFTSVYFVYSTAVFVIYDVIILVIWMIGMLTTSLFLNMKS